jgi:hypothetical protein
VYWIVVPSMMKKTKSFLSYRLPRWFCMYKLSYRNLRLLILAMHGTYVGQACPLRRPGCTLKLFVWHEINVGIDVDQRPD